MLISFEGIDHSGKSTQAKMLFAHLKKMKKKVILVREPGGTEISERIRDILLDKNNHSMKFLTEFLLFSSARQQLVEEVIKPHLKKKFVVICDRYFDSSTAYQGYGGKLNLKDVNAVNRIATSGLTPDITFFLDIDYKEAIYRSILINKKADRIEQKQIPYYKKVMEGYREIARLENKRVLTIKGTENADLIHIKISEIIDDRLKKSRK
jgi:dTMP kinase